MCFTVFVLVVGLSICILDLFLYLLSLIYAKFCNVIESRKFNRLSHCISKIFYYSFL